MLGSEAYVHAHRSELDRAAAAIVFDEGTGRVTGFSLGGRHDIEPSVRESLAPIESWGVMNHTYDAPLGTDNFDFLLEGVPNLIANQDGLLFKEISTVAAPVPAGRSCCAGLA